MRKFKRRNEKYKMQSKRFAFRCVKHPFIIQCVVCVHKCKHALCNQIIIVEKENRSALLHIHSSIPIYALHTYDIDVHDDESHGRLFTHLFK